jgi:starch-binding outer membrane protein, SusD/RagB family
MKKIYTILFPGLLLLASCEKLVEVDYPANQIGTTQVFEDINTANSALACLYASLRDQSIIKGGSYYGADPLLSSYTDDLDCYFNDQNGVADLYQNQQQATNTKIETIWETAYQQVYYANSIIYGSEHSTALSDTDKDRIKGEALLVRSLIYFYLQQLFGDIPYTTSLDYEYNRKISKTDAATVMEHLEADLTEAAGLLQDEYRDSERIYPNRKVAQLLLARIYLVRNEWSLAEKIADTILLSPLYQFQPDINEVFHKSGTHILWQLKPKKSGNATTEAMFYYFTGSAPNSYVLTQNLINTFDDADLRKQNWMAPVTFGGQTWYRPYKYKNHVNVSNYDEYSIVFRLEEVYFIMAEALAKQNRFDEALPFLNATRERAGLTAVTSLSGDDFITELLAEKRREFFTESGHRFLDLKRWGKLDVLSAVKPNWDDYKEVWPLPQSEMLLNTNLSPQNNGY